MAQPCPAQFLDPASETAAIERSVGSSAVARASGIVLTPPDLALQLAAATLPQSYTETLRVLDPACGTGRLLTAAARIAAERNISIEMFGVEHHQALADACREALPDAHITCADALAHTFPPDIDVVLMNPPYRGRMRTNNDAITTLTDALSTRFGDRLGPYADPAAGFMLLGLDLLSAGGRLGVIVPVSIVAARDAAQVRSALSRTCDTVTCWSAPAAFEAQVHTASLVMERRPESRDTPCPWPSMLASAAGVPLIDTIPAATIGAIATATADFRDEYYALRDHLVECDVCDNAVGLLTCGLVEPGLHLHGQRPARVLGTRWQAPGVRRASDIEQLLVQRLVPKVIVATQTPLIEAVADPEGQWLPVTPLIRVSPEDPDHLWRIAVSLFAPQASALALHRHFGAGRAPATLRLRAKDVEALPLVDDSPSLAAAIAALQSVTPASLIQAGHACAAAWGPFPDGLLDWWVSRLPRRLMGQ